MYISRIEHDNRKRYKIYGTDGYLFSLYEKEIKKLKLIEDSEVDDAVLDVIYGEILYMRARERALFLLDRQPYSAYMLERKLIAGGFPMSVVDRVILFLKDYHYLDDTAYVELYITGCQNRKSKRQMKADLLSKGIDGQLIDDYYMEHDDSEEECFRHQFQKYISGKNLADPVIRQKVFRHFYSKGFAVSTIQNAFQ